MIAERGFNQIWFSIECNDVSDKWKISVIGILRFNQIRFGIECNDVSDK